MLRAGVSVLQTVAQIQPATCLCKVYWNTATHLHLHTAYGYLGAIVAELSCDRPCGLQSLNYLLSSPLQKKFANPSLDEKEITRAAGFQSSAACHYSEKQSQQE